MSFKGHSCFKQFINLFMILSRVKYYLIALVLMLACNSSVIAQNIEHLELPEEIGQLNNLSHLNLRRNHIFEIPEEIKELKNLKTLYLDDNQF